MERSEMRHLSPLLDDLALMLRGVMTDWEYLVLRTAPPADDAQMKEAGYIPIRFDQVPQALSTAGRGGWELVAAFDAGTETSTRLMLFLKRPRGIGSEVATLAKELLG